MKIFHKDIGSIVRKNKDYRRVLNTGDASQIVAMSLLPGEDIGEEAHEDVEQTLVIVEGSGKVTLDDYVKRVHPGDAVVVRPKVLHNLENDGDTFLKLFTVYVPPNHIDGRVHKTKADAEADIEDQDYVF